MERIDIIGLNGNDGLHYDEVTKVSNTEETLKQRGNNYGSFQKGAYTMQRLKETVRCNDGYDKLGLPQREAIDMILHKIGRIVNGNPNHVDSWHDIAGYAKLIENFLNGEGEQ